MTVSGVTVSDGNSGSNYNVTYVNNTTSTISPAAITVRTSDVSRTYDGALDASGTPVVTSGTLYTNVSNSSTLDSLSGGSYAFTNANAGSGNKTVTVSGVTVSDGNSGGNYNVTYANNTTSTITPAALMITANGQTITYGTAPSTTAVSYSGFVLGETSASLTTQPTVANTAPSVNVSTYTGALVPSGAVDGNYNITYVNGTLTISPAALTVAANNGSKTYGATYGFGNGATVTGLLNSDTVTGETLNSTGAVSTAAVGGYNIVPSAATGTGLSNYTISYVNGTLTVSPAALTVAANNGSKTYGATYGFGDGATVTGLVNSDTVTGETLNSTGAVSTAAVGGYNIVPSAATGTGLSNYTISYVNGTLTVSPAALTVAANNGSKTYGATYGFGDGATVTGLVNSDTVTGETLNSTGAVSTAAVGGYNIVPSAATGTGLSNYTISYVNGTLTVSPAALTITANGQTITYGTTVPTTTASYTGFVNGETSANLTTQPTLASSHSGVQNAGTYTGNYTASGAVDTNYTISYVAGTLVVNPAALTITANGQTITYGTTVPTTTASYTGFVNGETSANLTTQPTLASSHSGVQNAGTYTGNYTASGAVDTNYTISYVAGTLVVNPAALTITANGQTITYGATVPTTTASYTGFVNGETSASLTTQPTLASSHSGVQNAGTYTGNYTASGAVDTNYTISYVAGDLTVNPAALTITANGQTITYGATVPTTTASYTGFVNGETSASLTTQPTLASSKSGVQNAGTYTGNYTASGAVDTNYTISYVAGDLTVNPAALTITANGQTITYGTTVPTTTASYTGFVNGETSANLTTQPTLASSHSGVQNAGTYTGNYTASGAVDTNYTISYVAGDLTVNPAALTITANGSQTITYGATVPTTTAPATPASSTRRDQRQHLTTQPTLASSKSGIQNASTYSGNYTASGAVDTNYTISYVAGDLTVNPAALTITANGQTITYGTTVPTTTASYTGFVNGETSASLTTHPTLASSHSGVQNAGTYTGNYTASGAVDANYTISYVAGDLTINPAALLITANGQTITYGTTVPTTTASYTGFVNGETSASLTTQPTLASSHSGVQNAGTYTGNYTASGAIDTNYTISYVAGDLTVNPAALTITANGQTITYGTTVPTTTASYTGFVNGETSASLTTQPTLASSHSGVQNAGTYTGNYTASGAVDTNYTISYVTRGRPDGRLTPQP